MARPFRVVKLLDEGTSEPFIARLHAGLLEMRDVALGAKVGAGAGIPSFERARHQFDDAYQPVLNALLDMRKAMKRIAEMVEQHRGEIASGKIVRFQAHAFTISEGIDVALQREVASFLDRSTLAFRGTQKVVNEFGVDIGFLYAKRENFDKGLARLRLDTLLLAEYLSAVRNAWSEKLSARRNALEHEGWILPIVDYRVDETATPPRVDLIEPEIDGLPVTHYVEYMGSRVISFVENVVVYGFKCALIPPITILEIPLTARHPDFPRRFRLGIPDAGTMEWVLKYADSDFP